MISAQGYNIDDSRSNGRTQFKTKCPKCPTQGHKNINDQCLSVNTMEKKYNCHKCGFSGFYGEASKVEHYKLPSTQNLTDLKLEHLQYFSFRGISPATVIRNGIRSSKGDWFAFPYFEGENIVNIKFRALKEKKFMQVPEAKQTMYKFNDIVGQKSIIVCEGEFDALSWEEAGFTFATSVGQGAPNVADHSIEKKLACVYNCFDIFEQAETIYLSVDSDPNGQRLQKELLRIFTTDKCKIIDFRGLNKGNGEPCKDANDVLLAHGKGKLVESFNNSRDPKVSGIFECQDFEFDIIESYRHGQPKGTTTYYRGVDLHWTHRMGEVTLWTGYNNEGKSLFLKQLLLLKSKFEGWKHAVYTPEEMPLSEWYTDLIESLVGKSADPTQAGYWNYMTELQLKLGIQFMQDHFYAVFPEEDQTLDELLSKFSYLVRKKNIRTITIDPYNQVQHLMNPGEREDLYISRFMSKLKRFAVEHEVAVHLIAHQVTPKFEPGKNYPEPNIYLIKGGGTFADKADNVCAIWREYRNTDIMNTSVRFISQKIKKQKLTGFPGGCVLSFDRSKNRYYENGSCPFDNEPKMDQDIFVEHSDDELVGDENVVPF